MPKTVILKDGETALVHFEITDLHVYVPMGKEYDNTHNELIQHCNKFPENCLRIGRMSKNIFIYTFVDNGIVDPGMLSDKTIEFLTDVTKLNAYKTSSYICIH